MNEPRFFVDELEWTIFVFIGIDSYDKLAFEDFIDTVSSKYKPIDVIVASANKLSEKATEEIIEVINKRFKVKSNFLSYEFNDKGECKPIHSIDKKRIKTPKDKAFYFDKFLDNALKNIVQKSNILINAPNGKIFSKPSGDVCDYFLKASNTFTSLSEMSFISLMIAKKYGNLFKKEITTFYVDTIDLYPIVLLVRKIIHGFDKMPIVHSFSSYDKCLKVLKRMVGNESLVIISATSSHGLSKYIIDNINSADHNNILTLFASKMKNSGNNKILYEIEVKNNRGFKNLPQIRIAGERFTIDVEAPKTFLMKKILSPAVSRCRYRDFLDTSNIISIGMGQYSGFPVYVNIKNLLKLKLFKDWLKKEITNNMLASTSHIIIPDSHTEDFIKWINNQTTFFNSISKPKIIKGSEINEHKNAIKSALVLSLVTSQGTTLLQISRDLRRCKKLGKIVYILGVCTVTSYKSYEVFISNLKQGGHHYFDYAVFPIGDFESLKHSLKNDTPDFSQIKVNKKIKIQEDSQSLKDKCNNTFHFEKKLKLHSGFVFWVDVKKEYNTKGNSGLLFATLCVILQYARENKDLLPENSFNQELNRQVLLDPENFYRFNDTLIQACLLRAAHDFELDYSKNKELSISMANLFERSIIEKDDSILFELLLAIKSRRLMLFDEHWQKVKKTISNNYLFKLFGFDSDANLPF